MRICRADLWGGRSVPLRPKLRRRATPNAWRTVLGRAIWPFTVTVATSWMIDTIGAPSVRRVP